MKVLSGKLRVNFDRGKKKKTLQCFTILLLLLLLFWVKTRGFDWMAAKLTTLRYVCNW